MPDEGTARHNLRLGRLVLLGLTVVVVAVVVYGLTLLVRQTWGWDARARRASVLLGGRPSISKQPQPSPVRELGKVGLEPTRSCEHRILSRAKSCTNFGQKSSEFYNRPDFSRLRRACVFSSVPETSLILRLLAERDNVRPPVVWMEHAVWCWVPLWVGKSSPAPAFQGQDDEANDGTATPLFIADLFEVV
jgi:hypothetical protein